MLERQRAKEAARRGEPRVRRVGEEERSGAARAGVDGCLVASELAGVSLGLVASIGVSLGSRRHDHSKGTLAQKDAGCEAGHLRARRRLGDHEPDSGSDASAG